MQIAYIRSLTISVAAAALMGLAACATAPEDPEQLAAFEEANDPLEPMNRYFFDLNGALDELVMKPLAGWYYVGLPNFVQDGVRNAVDNLRSPIVLANDLLQGEMERAGTTIGRFLINSTLGLAGLFDVASEFGLDYHDEDFGQTLAVWGAGEGPYLVLPILGPSNPRDAAGRVVDNFFDPLFYLSWSHDWATTALYARAGADAVDTRARNLTVLDEIKKGAIDYYATIRSLYRQHRNDAIVNGEGDGEASVSVLDFLDDEQASQAE
jgi:phospholipid-binding lipoprotein MlaA